MFVPVGWVVSWLLAPVAAMAALGLASELTTGAAVDEFIILSVAAPVLWLCLTWAVARALSGWRRSLHLTVCIVLVAAAATLTFMPVQHRAANSSTSSIETQKA